MYLSPESQRLLDDVRHSHEQLIEHFNADEALESALGDVDDERLQAPIDDGWSPARILVHLAEHDQGIEEASRRGIEHMIEHGLEHARSLWLARLPVASR